VSFETESYLPAARREIDSAGFRSGTAFLKWYGKYRKERERKEQTADYADRNGSKMRKGSVYIGAIRG
jgi:hypothetical protein